MSNTLKSTRGPVSLTRVAAFLAIAAFMLIAIIWAKAILVPLVFAGIFALTLRPLTNVIERYLHVKWLAILIAFLVAAVPITAAVLLFSYQTIAVLEDLPTITEEFQESLNRIFSRLTEVLETTIEVSGSEWVQDQFSDALDEPFDYIRGLVAGGAGLVGTLLLTLLYTFLLLLYRHPIYHFILGQFSTKTRSRMELVMADTQRVSYTYLKGLGLVMLILGVLNSVGLILIGIEYAFFWGFFAAFLAIIPYVGTFIGGLLPFLYALSTTTTFWQPMSVVALFVTIQAIEGNIITPKVVGSSIQVNPLAAIIALFFGGFVWGVEGLILALPLTAILRIFLVHSRRFRPFGLLLSDELSTREDEFLGRLDRPHYRIINFFRSTQNESFLNREIKVKEEVVSQNDSAEKTTVEVDLNIDIEKSSSVD